MADADLQHGNETVSETKTEVRWTEVPIFPGSTFKVPVREVVTETVEEAIPYTRLVQQTPDGTPYTGSSYLRLGGYIAADEAPLLPAKAKVTSTSVSLDNFGSSEGYYDSSMSNAAKETSAQRQGNTQTQNTQKMALGTPTAQPTTNRGVLIYSDQDFRVNAELGGYLEFQKGLGIYVDSGDTNVFVNAGQLNLTSQQGVTIQAGVPDYQASATQPACFADINIIASNNISQKAYGPLDEITYGDSYKNVHGNATELFLGAKQTWVLDAEVSGKMASSLTMFFGASSTIKLSVELNLTASASLTLKLSAEVSLSLTAKADFVFGIDYKMVTGVSTKTIVGADTATINSGLKTVIGDDIKIVAGIDFKNASVDSKLCQAYFESKGLDLGSGKIKVENTALGTKMGNIVLDSIEMKSKLRSLEVVL